jgi:type IV pilus assembly protein PilY1
VDYIINHAGGSDTVTVSQDKDDKDDQWQGGKWNILGTYMFDAGTGGNVQINFTRSGKNSDANADAVRFVEAIDGWDWATSSDDYMSRFLYTPRVGDYTATWTTDMLWTDRYEVYVWYVEDFNRSTAVPYTITHKLGQDTVYVDQRQNGGSWFSLGRYNFDAGTTGSVGISYTVTDIDTERVVADAVKFAPNALPPAIDIHRSHYYVKSETGIPYLVNIGEGEITYHVLTDDGDDEIEEGELLPVPKLVDVPADVKTSRTYAEERQNFANWYSFYRRRELTATAAIANLIVNVQGVNVGFASINDELLQPVLPVNVGGNDATDTLLDALYGLVLTRKGTPLRQGLEDVGEYFHADDNRSGGIGVSPYETAENGGECQQAFAIVMTDGYWNGDDPDVDNADKDEVAEPDNSIYDGPPYEDDYSNTLADVAMHYYENDLSPEDLTMDNGNPGLNDLVPTNQHDDNAAQHMATYTVSFGVIGTLDPADYDLDNGPYPTWPDPDTGANQYKVDDMWHAAVNGRGTFTSASNPIELRDSLISIMQNIEARIGSSSSVSVNGDELYDEVSSDIRMFQASYNSEGWIGDVKAHTVDLATGSVEVDSYLWSAADELEKITPTSRIIATYDGSQGIPFRFDDPGMTSELKDMLDASDATNAENMLNYLRGDATNEEKNGGTFRNRLQKLGDIVHSSPTYKGGYLYAGGNDGMLHAFNATDGKEVFAYVPKLVFENLNQLSGPLYVHRNYVDLSPAAKTVTFLGTDQTILVGGLGKGGRGYYALDITDPASITTEAALAGKVKWEYPKAGTAQSEIDDMGYSFSRAAIVNSEAGWVVIVGNGYNSVSGKAKLLILDADNGDLLKSIDTGVGGCNGLSIPIPIDVNYDDKVDYVYAGDLKGNLWKFDLTVPGPTDPGYDAAFDPEDYFDVAYKYAATYTYSGLQKIGTTPMPLFQAKSLAGPQPITAKPDVMIHPDKEGYMVVFGTGKYLGESDIADTSTQTIYGIWDYGDDVDDSEYLGSFERASTPILSNQPNYDVDLQKQDDIVCDPLVTTCDGDLFVVGTASLRVTTGYTPDWGTTSKDAVDDCLEGIGVDECDPDGYGANPNPVNSAGWYYDLPISGERVVTDTLLRDGKAIVIAYTPEQTPCGSGGNSIIMEMNAGTGARLDKPQFDINGDGKIDDNDLVNIGTEDDPIWVAPTGLKSEGRLYPPAILRIDEDKEKKYFSSSRGRIVEMTEKAAKLGLSYWIEYE